MATLKTATKQQTSKEKTREMIAKAAGLASKDEPAFDPTTATFKVVVSSPVGPFNVGQELEAPYQWSNLPEQKYICTYYQLALEDTTGEETELKPKQVWVAIQEIDTEGLDTPDAIDEARISYLQTVQSASQAMSQEQFVKLLTTNEIARDAEKLGSEVSEELQVVIETGIDGKKTWDGTPLKVEAELVKHYGDNALSAMPAVNSRKTGKTTIKDGVSVSTDTVPADYNGLTDYFIGQLPGEDKPRVIRWYDTFVRGMPHVKRLVNHAELLSTMANTPANLDAKLIPQEYIELWNNGSPDKPAVQGKRADLTGDITAFVNRVANAVAFYQAKRAISEHLPKTVGYELVGGSVDTAFKRRKPIQMLTLREENGRIRETASMSPVPLSAFIRYGRNAEKCAAQGGALPKLVELAKVTKKPQQKATAGSDKEQTSYKIEKVSQLDDVFSNAKDYIGHHLKMVEERLADKREGGRFCYLIVTMRDELDALINEDKNGNSPIVERADTWNKEQVRANAAQERADLERKKNLLVAKG